MQDDPVYVAEIIDALESLLPGCDKDLIDKYALLVLTKGEYTALHDVHDAWSVWKFRINPAHKSIVPFESLTYEVKELDRKYTEAIRKVAKMYNF